MARTSLHKDRLMRAESSACTPRLSAGCKVPKALPLEAKDLSKHSNINVAVRIRPFNAREAAETGGSVASVFEVVAGNTIVAKAVDRFGLESEYAKEKIFGFDVVFSSLGGEHATPATQERIFEELGVPILANCLDAYNGCLLAYGQTGAGKSHSVLGDLRHQEERGLLPRACEALFEMVEQRRSEAEAAGTSLHAVVLASYLEIYQERMFDLLVSARQDLHVRVHPALGPHVPSLTESPVANIQEVQELLDFGAKNRAVAATTMNAGSSRSHAIFTIDLRLNSNGPQGAKDTQSKLRFVDLAGSEKQKKAGASGERLQEGIAINQSLSALSRVIHALAATEGKTMLPPFRESKLTLLLKDALMGNSRTVLLACISPSRINLEESIGTLEFASRCKLIKTHAKRNEQDKSGLINSLCAEKKQVEVQLLLEQQQRRALEHELEQKMEETFRNRELAQRMREEKLEIERQLHELEAQAGQQGAEQHQPHSQALLLPAEAEEKTAATKTRQAKEPLLVPEGKRQRSLEAITQAEAWNTCWPDAALQRHVIDRNDGQAEQHQCRRVNGQRAEERHLQASEHLTSKAVEQEGGRCLDDQSGEHPELANRTWRERELDRLEREKESELLRLDTERRRAVAELHEKLAKMERQEEEQKRSAVETRHREAEWRERIAQEVRLREQREEDLKRELLGLQSLSDSWALERQDLQRRAREQKASRGRLLQELGIVGMEPGNEEASRSVPRLVNLHPDPVLEGCLIYCLLPGETRVGADPQRCRVFLTGLGVADEVCAIVNTGNEHLHVRPTQGGLVRVNGTAVAEAGQVLASGDRLAIGRAHIFRVLVPMGQRDAERDRDEERFESAMRELQTCAQLDPRWRRGVDAAVFVVKRDYGTREANELLDEARRASEVVAEANEILRLIPRQWADISHYELAVLFEADGPPVVCVVARYERSNDQAGAHEKTESLGSLGWKHRLQSAGIWEASRFVDERLSDMQEAAEVLRKRPHDGERAEEHIAHQRALRSADWESRVWREVTLHEYRKLAQLHGKLSELQTKGQEGIDGGGSPGFLSWFRWRGAEDKEPSPPDGSEGMLSGGGRLWEWLGRAAGLSPKAAPPCTGDTLVPPLEEVDLRGTATPKAKARRALPAHAQARASSWASSRGAPPTQPTESAASTWLAGGERQGPAKVMVRRATLQAAAAAAEGAAALPPHHLGGGRGFWPAATEETRQGHGALPRQGKEVAGSADVFEGQGGGPDSRRRPGKGWVQEGDSSSPPLEREAVNIQVGMLFDGRLGVRLRHQAAHQALEGLVVSGFDVLEAEALGWRVRDEIVAVNGCPVRTREEFTRELVEARNELPIVFTVLRAAGEASCGEPPGAGRSGATRRNGGSAPFSSETTVGRNQGGSRTAHQHRCED